MITLGEAATKERIDSERNQGRAPNMDWLDHDRLGFNYRLSDLACALGLAQLERLDEMLAGRDRVAAAYREALGAIDELTLPCPDAGQAQRGWFVFVVQLPRGTDRDACIEALRAHGVPSKPYFPAIHLMSFYREQFGHREGEFPVCEDVAARSIALPFFPADDRGRGRPGGAGARRGARALTRGGSATKIGRRHVPLLRAPARRLPAPERLDRLRLAPGALRRAAEPGARRHAGRAGDHLRGRPRRAARRAGAGRCGAEQRLVPVRGRRRGHPHGDRAAGDRARGRGRRPAPHRALAQRPGRDRHGDVHPRARGRGGGRGDAPRRRPDRRGRAPPRLADAGLHPPAAGATRVPQPPPAGVRLDARARPPAVHGRRWPRPERCRSGPAPWRA